MLPKSLLPIFSIAGLVQPQKFTEVRTVEIQSLEDLESILRYVKRSQYLQQQFENDDDFDADLRAVSSSMLSQIDQYGCWCHFDDFEVPFFNTAKGTPVDGFDSACKQYYHSLQCILSDNVCGANVDPHKIGYSLVITSTDNQLDYDCVAPNNGDQCKIAVCQSQLQLSLNFNDQFASGNYLNLSDLSASQGSFDFISECSAATYGNKELLGCCGDYPSGTRRPVMVELGTAVDSACCAKPNGNFVVYNSFIDDCCSEAPYLSPKGTCDD